MFLTPPDVLSQTFLAVPVYLLYELGIVMARVFSIREEPEPGAEPTSKG
jgi:sec-independent protein translocase protein TatC